MEDIDTIGADYKIEDDKIEGRKYLVLLARLLNALNGVTSKEGYILIIITNYIEKLNSILIRPGYINLRVKLNYIDTILIT